MIRCTNCNTINSPDALFCSNCNSFLEWTGVKATADEIAAAKAGVAPAPADEAAQPAETPATAKPGPAPEPEPEPEREPEAKPEPLKFEPPPEPEPAPLPEPEARPEAAAAKGAPASASAPAPAPAPAPEAQRTERTQAEDKQDATPPAAQAGEKAAAAGPAVLAAKSQPEPEPDSEPEPKPEPKPAATMRAKPRPKPEPEPVLEAAAPKPPEQSPAPVADAEHPAKATEAAAEPPPVRETTPPPPIHRGPPPPPPPPPPPLIPDTQPVVDKPPEPEKQDFRYRALPAHKPEMPPTTATILAATAAQPAAQQPAPRRPGFLAQVKQAIGIDEEAAAGQPGQPGASAAAGAAAAATAAQAANAATTPPTASNAPAAAQSAAVKPQEPAALKPQAAQPQARQPQVQQPDARKPTAEVKRRVVAPPPKPAGEPAYNPGDLICGNCGAGNDPTRRFCRKCGTNLVDAVMVAPPPWYRRIFRRRDKALMAGQRPTWMGDQERRRGGLTGTLNRFFRLRRLVMGLLVVGAVFGIASYAFLPDVKGKVDQGIDQVREMIMPSYQAISPHAYVGSVPAVKDHAEELAFDAGSNTYWAAPSSPTLSLTVTFDRPFNLGALLMNTAPVETRTQFDRPKTVELSFPNSDAKPIVLNLQDSDKQIQNPGLDAKGVQVVVLTFKDYYPAAVGGDNVLALTDIQFQERR